MDNLRSSQITSGEDPVTQNQTSHVPDTSERVAMESLKTMNTIEQQAPPIDAKAENITEVLKDLTPNIQENIRSTGNKNIETLKATYADSPKLEKLTFKSVIVAILTKILGEEILQKLLEKLALETAFQPEAEKITAPTISPDMEITGIKLGVTYEGAKEVAEKIFENEKVRGPGDTRKFDGTKRTVKIDTRVATLSDFVDLIHKKNKNVEDTKHIMGVLNELMKKDEWLSDCTLGNVRVLEGILDTAASRIEVAKKKKSPMKEDPLAGLVKEAKTQLTKIEVKLTADQRIEEQTDANFENLGAKHTIDSIKDSVKRKGLEDAKVVAFHLSILKELVNRQSWLSTCTSEDKASIKGMAEEFASWDDVNVSKIAKEILYTLELA